MAADNGGGGRRELGLVGERGETPVKGRTLACWWDELGASVQCMDMKAHNPAEQAKGSPFRGSENKR